MIHAERTTTSYVILFGLLLGLLAPVVGEYRRQSPRFRPGTVRRVI